MSFKSKFGFSSFTSLLGMEMAQGFQTERDFFFIPV